MYIVTVVQSASPLRIAYVGRNGLTNKRHEAAAFTWDEALTFLAAYGECHEAHILRLS